MSMAFTNIPSELKALPQWVLWRKEQRNGKCTKVPYQVNGLRASATNPYTWSRFEEVCKVHELGIYSGIGYVFSADDPYVGVDVDDCMVKGQLMDDVSGLMNRLNSYTEYSQSKNGIHIILKAEKLGSRNRQGKYEMYDRGRFFVMTGDHVEGTPTSIESRQQELTDMYEFLFKKKVRSKKRDGLSLSDQMVLDKAGAAKNGRKFAQLYAGNIGIYGDDDSVADLALCNMLTFWTQDPNQIDRLFRGSGLMREKWERVDYRERTIGKALDGLSTERRKSPHQESSNKQDTCIISDKWDYALTDLGNSKRFIDQYGHCCFYVYPFREWYIWNGAYWEKDQTGGMMRFAKTVAEGITRDAKGRSEAMIRHANKSESLAAMKNMIHLAKSELHVYPDRLDQHHWLLNVKNGTVDLKTGKLVSPEKKNYLTQMAMVEYREEAKAPLWGSFLERIMAGNKELIRFIQKAVGYSITGSVREQCILFLYGSGRNGKSTFLDILDKLMGSYSKTLLSKSFMVKKNEGVNNDIAELKGARFVTTSEGEQGQYLAESLVKQLTGGDRRKARFLFGEYFEYEPTDKIWFMTNHKPIIKGNDEGIWRRVFLIPFAVSIPAEERDRDLGEKLSKEISGILNWAIEGCLLYLKEGLRPPREILAASQAYRAEMDVLSAFVEECCVVDPVVRVKLKDLYVVYVRWCQENGSSPMSGRKLAQELRDRGYDSRNSTGNQVYVYGLLVS